MTLVFPFLPVCVPANQAMCAFGFIVAFFRSNSLGWEQPLPIVVESIGSRVVVFGARDHRTVFDCFLRCFQLGADFNVRD